MHRIKKTLHKSVFFFVCSTVLLLFLPPKAGFAEYADSISHVCEPPAQKITGKVERIVDGDTLKLADGKKLRLIGINASELARQGKPAEPLAVDARARLAKLVPPGSDIIWSKGTEPQDRYGRWLAYLFLPNGASVQRTLVQEGLAVRILVPPNTAMDACFLQAEQQARKFSKGLWQLRQYQAVEVRSAGTLKEGLHFFSGKLRFDKETQKSIWLTLGDDLKLRIPKDNLQYFPGRNWQQYLDKKIIVRGWVKRQGNRVQMTLAHPGMLEVLH